MIAHLTGKVLEKEEKTLIVDVNGLGYRVSVLTNTLSQATVGCELSLHIHHHISSDSEDLYGFPEKKDLFFFKLLITVPSVGPRTAIGILDIASPAILSQAVAEDDVTILTKVSGVGKKTAERILVELKEKIDAPEITGATGTVQQEAVEALISIGYTSSQARAAVQKIPKEVASVEEAVKAALQQKT